MKPDTSFVLKSGHFHLLTTLPSRRSLARNSRIRLPGARFAPRRFRVKPEFVPATCAFLRTIYLSVGCSPRLRFGHRSDQPLERCTIVIPTNPPHYAFVLPDGYVGWVQVIFNDPKTSRHWEGLNLASSLCTVSSYKSRIKSGAFPVWLSPCVFRGTEQQSRMSPSPRSARGSSR
jgi:hypothetical protein